MLKLESSLVIADNSGAKKVKILSLVSRYNFKRVGIPLGSLVVGVIKENVPKKKLAKKSRVHCLILSVKKQQNRGNGIFIKSNENRAIVMDMRRKRPYGKIQTP